MLIQALIYWAFHDVMSRTVYRNNPKYDRYRMRLENVRQDVRPIMLHRRLFNLS
jgi:hypothetical protein